MLLLLRYKTGLSGSRKRGNSSSHRTPSRKRSRKDSQTVNPTKEDIFEEDNPSLSDLRINHRISKDCVATESVNFSTLNRANSPAVGLSESQDKKSSVPGVVDKNDYCRATRGTKARGARGKGHSSTAQKNNSSFDIAVAPVHPLGTGRGKLTGQSLGFISAQSESIAVSTRSRTVTAGRNTNHSTSVVQARNVGKIDNGAAAAARGGRGGRRGGINRYDHKFFGGTAEILQCTRSAEEVLGLTFWGSN
jgi:hypothetical protein